MSFEDRASVQRLSEAVNRLDATIAAALPRLAAALPPPGGMTAALGASGAALAGAGAGGAGMAVAGAMSAAAGTAALAAVPKAIDVRVMNDRSAAVPVTIVDPPAKEERTSLFGSVITTAAGAAGSFIGGILGGLASPIATAINLIEVTIALGAAGSVIGQIDRLIDKLALFGVLPVKNLLDTVVTTLDQVIARLLPLIDWAAKVVEQLVNWLGSAIATATAWIGSVVNALAGFIATYVSYLLTSVVRPAIEATVRSLLDTIVRPAIDHIVNDLFRSLGSTVGGILFAGIFAAADVLKAVFDWAWKTLEDVMKRAFNAIIGAIATLVSAINTVLAKLPGSYALPVPAPIPITGAPPAFPDVAATAAAGVAAGRAAATSLAEKWFGPAPKGAPAGAGGSVSGKLADITPGAAPGRPTFVMPGLAVPQLTLPVTPKSKEVEKILGTGAAAPAAPAAPGGAGPTSSLAPFTVNGGITVQISAEQIDTATAEQTARSIAEHVLDEIGRLTDNDRFRRGLPTAAVA
jgi:riboflavin transporter FmnP